ncbi:rRNA adenine N-6-methyltransferase family protein [Nocardia fluminea]
MPSVDSAILRITRRAEPSVLQRDSYTELVRTAFSGIGGTVRASLRTRYQGVDEALTAAGIPHDTVVAYVHPISGWSCTRFSPADRESVLPAIACPFGRTQLQPRH